MDPFVERIGDIMSLLEQPEKALILQRCAAFNPDSSGPFGEQVALAVGLKNSTEFSKLTNGTHKKPTVRAKLAELLDVDLQWLLGNDALEPLAIMAPLEAFEHYAHDLIARWRSIEPRVRTRHVAPVRGYAASEHISAAPVDAVRERMIGQQLGHKQQRHIGREDLDRILQCRFHRVSFSMVEAFAEVLEQRPTIWRRHLQRGHDLFCILKHDRRETWQQVADRFQRYLLPAGLFQRLTEHLAESRADESDPTWIDDAIEMLWRQHLLLEGEDRDQAPGIPERFVTQTGREQWCPLLGFHRDYDG